MSSPGSTVNENTSSSKKEISPARNIIGIVVLVAVIIAGFFQYSAVFAYNRAVKALDARTQDEDKGLMEVAEVESLVGKAPDGPGVDFQDAIRSFTKTKYTWRGPLKSYTLTAYYTKGAGPCLHHFESDGATYAAEPAAAAPPSDVIATGPAAQKARGKMGRSMVPGGGKAKAKATASDKVSTPATGAEPSKTATTVAPVKPAELAAEASKPTASAPPGDAKPPE